MIYIRLDETTRDALQVLRRRGRPAGALDFLRMISLSDADAGWEPAHIAAHLSYGYRTVLNALHEFARCGAEAPFPRRHGPAPDAACREQFTGLLRDLVGQDSTGTAA
jgi:hypothetical protein